MNSVSGDWRIGVIPGILLIAFGIAVLLFPALLVLIIAACFILAGILLVLGGLKLKANSHRNSSVHTHETETVVIETEILD